MLREGKKTVRLYFHPTSLFHDCSLTKQACRDESVVSLFFSPITTYIALYFYISSTVKMEKSIHRLPIYKCTHFLFCIDC